MSLFRRTLSVFVLLLLVGLAVPAQAQCATADAPPDQTWNCLGIDADGVDVGVGNDDVYVFGAVNG